MLEGTKPKTVLVVFMFACELRSFSNVKNLTGRGDNVHPVRTRVWDWGWEKVLKVSSRTSDWDWSLWGILGRLWVRTVSNWTWKLLLDWCWGGLLCELVVWGELDGCGILLSPDELVRGRGLVWVLVGTWRGLKVGDLNGKNDFGDVWVSGVNVSESKKTWLVWVWNGRFCLVEEVWDNKPVSTLTLLVWDWDRVLSDEAW